jgi:hypothetical protein
MTRRFQSGGALREGALYVERQADRHLPEALLEGELCHVLAPRQMGKSSLRARVEAGLRARGLRCGSVDLTTLGSTGVTVSQWYFGLVDALSRSLGLGDPARFWKRRSSLPPVTRWSAFLREEVLGQVEGPVIVFLDEIDAVRSLRFSAADLFASIRALYNARAHDPELDRLRFAMMGVATPSELEADLKRAPFNVGQSIRLLDFTREEAKALLPGLREITPDPQPVLDAVLEWTEGHPYMTQRICELIAREGLDPSLPVRAHVAQLVNEVFLKRGRVEDSNLSAIERSFAKGRLGEAGRAMLALYWRLLDDEHVVAVSDDPVQTALRLSGITAERDDGATVWVCIRNTIVASVFDHAWVDERLAAG